MNAWRGFDDYLKDTSQSAADTLTRTDNGGSQPVTDEGITRQSLFGLDFDWEDER